VPAHPGMPDRAPPLLDRLPPVLLAAGITLRWLTAGETAAGTHLLVDLFVWTALAARLASGALRGGIPWRCTGAEFGLIALVLAGLVSLLRASCTFVAVDPALSFLYGALLYTLTLQTPGPVSLLRLVSSSAFALGVYALIQFFILFPQTRAEFPRLPVDVARRLEAREVMATFFYPNTFGGYLAFVLPLLAGLLLDSRTAGLRGLVPTAAAAATGLAAMAMTGSAGAWTALGMGTVAFAVLAATRRRGRSWAVGAGAAVALLGAAGLAAALPRLAQRSLSFRHRQAYWTAAFRMFRTSPMLGVGLDNFQDYYPEFKPEIPQETRKVHNDYLQLLAETGAAGLLAFLAAVGLALRPALCREEAVPVERREDSPPAFLAASGLAAFLLAPAVGGRIAFGPALVTGAVWLAFFLLWRPPSGPPVFTRVGLAAGLAALLAHLAVDFDLSDRGVSATLFLGLALGSVLRGTPPGVPLSRGVSAGAAAVLAVLVLPISLWMVPRWIAAESAVDEAREALERFEEESRRGNLDTLALSRALLLSEEARRKNTLEADAILLQARAQFRFWDLLRRRNPADEGELRRQEQIVLLTLEDALRIRPRDLGAWGLKVWGHREFRQFYLERASGGGGSRERCLAWAETHLAEALETQRRALALYPTWALNVYTMARLLDLRGEEAEAVAHYRRALELHRRAAAEPWSTGRLELPPLPLARTLRRLDRPLEAHESLRLHLRRLVGGLPPEEARRRIERCRHWPELLGGAGDERDDLLRPVIEDATDRILRTLPP